MLLGSEPEVSNRTWFYRNNVWKVSEGKKQGVIEKSRYT